MSTANPENDRNLRLQGIDLERAQRDYERKRDEYRHGVRRITSAAREEIAKLRFARDEALLLIRKEQVHKNYCKDVAERGFES